MCFIMSDSDTSNKDDFLSEPENSHNFKHILRKLKLKKKTLWKLKE